MTMMIMMTTLMRVMKKNDNEIRREEKQLEDINFINGIIQKIRKISAKIRRSSNASDELKQLLLNEETPKGNCLRFKMDMEVRWYSTLYMVERYIKLHKYVWNVLNKINAVNRPEQLTPMELEIIKDIKPMMKTVEYGITQMSGASYSTASIVILLTSIMQSWVNKYCPETVQGKTFKGKLLEAILFG